MASCPNINLNEWKELVSARGENTAYALWDLYEGEIPDSEFGENATVTGDTVPQAKSRKVILEKVKGAAKQMGINITTLTDYAKANPAVNVRGINGVTDLAKKTIAIAKK